MTASPSKMRNGYTTRHILPHRSRTISSKLHVLIRIFTHISYYDLPGNTTHSSSYTLSRALTLTWQGLSLLVHTDAQNGVNSLHTFQFHNAISEGFETKQNLPTKSQNCISQTCATVPFNYKDFSKIIAWNFPRYTCESNTRRSANQLYYHPSVSITSLMHKSYSGGI